MSDAVIGLIGSIIVGALTLCGVVYQSKKNNDSILTKIEHQSEMSDAKLDAKIEAYQAVTNEKISELTREVRAHNNHQERISVLEAEERRQNARIDKLENRAS